MFFFTVINIVLYTAPLSHCKGRLISFHDDDDDDDDDVDDNNNNDDQHGP